MDPKLAAIYGTGNYAPQVEESDLEKMAAAELLVKLAEEEGVDLDRFNDQEIADMITSLYKTAQETPAEEKKEEEKKEKSSQFGAEHEKKETPAEEKKEEEKKEEEKVAEADFLGRVMAHAMVHELREIEKQAQTGEESQTARFLARSGHALGQGLKADTGPEGPQIGAARLGARRAGAAISGAARKVVETAKAHPTATKALAGVAAGTAAALAAKKLFGKKKEQEKKGSVDDSAFEQLAQQAAFEMAKEAGYIDEQGNFLVQQTEEEKQASALDQALYVRALQICEESGIPVEWNQE